MVINTMNMRPCPTGMYLYTIQPGDTLWLLAQRYNTTIYAIAAANPEMDPNNLYIGQTIRIRPGYGFNPPGVYPAPAGIGKAEVYLMNEMRMLWEQHVAWTRMVIISMAAGLPDAALVTKRLLRNPDDFEAALRPYYGAENAAIFNKLFKEHLTIAGELVKAAKAGDTGAAADAEKRWYANADEIAAFLNKINPYWSKEAMTAMLHNHLALTKTEAVFRLDKDYAKDIETYDRIEKQALGMADAFTDGIVKQFPEKFRN